ncbi:MAG TPA: nitroreductase family protein, partial [Candidatus Aminicenantes bacterium]|nr:nitroreductase family protein [Candidatus Aminicenantes bacterium]
MTKVCRVSSLWLVLSAFALLSLWAAEPNGEKLPPPRKGEDAFMKILAKRASSRAFLPTKVFPRELLSDLLWAANGINRPESGKRTAPTAMNWQEIDLYVAMEE